MVLALLAGHFHFTPAKPLDSASGSWPRRQRWRRSSSHWLRWGADFSESAPLTVSGPTKASSLRAVGEYILQRRAALTSQHPPHRRPIPASQALAFSDHLPAQSNKAHSNTRRVSCVPTPSLPALPPCPSRYNRAQAASLWSPHNLLALRDRALPSLILGRLRLQPHLQTSFAQRPEPSEPARGGRLPATSIVRFCRTETTQPQVEPINRPPDSEYAGSSDQYLCFRHDPPRPD